MPTVPKLFPNSTIICIGDGPSLTKEDVDLCKNQHVIAINYSARLAPWADVVYSYHTDTLLADTQVNPDHRYVYSLKPGHAMWPILHPAGNFGLSLDPSALCGACSGAHAINLAKHLGAIRIILLGYDCQMSDIFSNWKKDIDIPGEGVYDFELWKQSFESMVGPLNELGIQVINASRITDLHCFEKMSLEEALSMPEEKVRAPYVKNPQKFQCDGCKGIYIYSSQVYEGAPCPNSDCRYNNDGYLHLLVQDQPVKLLIATITGELPRFYEYYDSLDRLITPSGTERIPVHSSSPAKNRNLAIKYAIDNNFTHIFLTDDDHVYPSDTVMKLLSRQVDIISGLYTVKFPPFPIVALTKGNVKGLSHFMDMTPYGSNELVEVGRVPGGCLLVSIDAMKKLQSYLASYYGESARFADMYFTLGQTIPDDWCDDVWFCDRAREAGLKIHIDTSVCVGHITKCILTPYHNGTEWTIRYAINEESRIS